MKQDAKKEIDRWLFVIVHAIEVRSLPEKLFIVALTFFHLPQKQLKAFYPLAKSCSIITSSSKKEIFQRSHTMTSDTTLQGNPLQLLLTFSFNLPLGMLFYI